MKALQGSVCILVVDFNVRIENHSSRKCNRQYVFIGQFSKCINRY